MPKNGFFGKNWLTYTRVRTLPINENTSEFNWAVVPPNDLNISICQQVKVAGSQMMTFLTLAGKPLSLTFH